MQINAKNDGVTIKLTQAEGRRMRDAAYIMRRIASNIGDRERAAKLDAAAAETLAAAMEYTPEQAQTKLDKQDAETPLFASQAEAEVVAAVPEILKDRSDEQKFISLDGVEPNYWYRCWFEFEQSEVIARLVFHAGTVWWELTTGGKLPIKDLQAIAKYDA